MAKPLITAEELRRLLHYSQESGLFTRRVRTNPCVQVGDVVATPHPRGYVLVSVGARKYLAHRLAWLYMTGEWPEVEIDHRNRVRSDNRWDNLREATTSQNRQNIALETCSMSGLRGAVFTRGRFRSVIKVNGNSVYLGRFKTAEEAHEAYLNAKREFHPYSTFEENDHAA